MVVAKLATDKLTLEKFLQFPETKPAKEYIDGIIYQKNMPQGKHSTLQIYLATTINQMALPQQKAYAFTELRCTFGGRSLVPDIAVFEWNRLPVDEEGEIKDAFEIPPDWIIEIMSPGQSNSLVIEKILFCLNQGTKLGWLIDVKEKIIIIFQKNQQPEVKRNNDILPVLSIFNDGQFSVNQLFQCLKFPKTNTNFMK